jgi:hypothetical protein
LRRSKRLDARQQLGEGERLHEVVVTAGLQALHAVVDLAQRAQDQRRRVVVGPAQRADDGEAVHARQHAVDDQRVVFLRARPEQPLLALGGLVHRESALAQPTADVVQDAGIVFDHQNAHQFRSMDTTHPFRCLHCTRPGWICRALCGPNSERRFARPLPFGNVCPATAHLARHPSPRSRPCTILA